MSDATRVRRRATRPAGPPADRTPVCRCHDGPVLVVTWRPRRPGADAEVIAVEYRHWTTSSRCPVPTEQLDPTTWGRP